MIQTVKSLKAMGSVIAITEHEKYILLYDNLNNLYYIHREQLFLERALKVFDATRKVHPHAKSVAFSQHGKLIASPANSRRVFMISYHPAPKKESAIQWHLSDTEVATFSPGGNYFATGGSDGRVYIHATATRERITSLPNKPDYISAIAFGHQSEIVAAGAYDQTITLFDLERNLAKGEFKTGSVVEALAFCKDDAMLYAVTRTGESLIFDLEKGEQVSRSEMFKEWPTQIQLSPDQRYALVSTRKNVLHIVKIPENLLIRTISLGTREISSIGLLKEHLVIGFVTGEVSFVDYLSGARKMAVELKTGNYAQAVEVMNKNALLLIHHYPKVRRSLGKGLGKVRRPGRGGQGGRSPGTGGALPFRPLEKRGGRPFPGQSGTGPGAGHPGGKQSV